MGFGSFKINNPDNQKDLYKKICNNYGDPCYKEKEIDHTGIAIWKEYRDVENAMFVVSVLKQSELDLQAYSVKIGGNSTAIEELIKKLNLKDICD